MYAIPYLGAILMMAHASRTWTSTTADGIQLLYKRLCRCQLKRDLFCLVLCTALAVRLVLETADIPVRIDVKGSNVLGMRILADAANESYQQDSNKKATTSNDIPMIGCAQTPEIERALKNASFRAHGVKQAASGIQLFNTSFVLKRPLKPGRQANTTMQEFQKLTTFPGPGFAKIFGFCTGKTRIPWLLLEKAFPLRLPFQERPSCPFLFSLVLNFVRHFILHPELAITRTSEGTRQFAMTDNRLILVDLENVAVGDSGLVDRPKQRTRRLSKHQCDKPMRCTISEKRTLWRGTVECQYSCWEGRCIRWSNSQHNLCKFRKSILANLAKYYVLLRPLFEASSDENFTESLQKQYKNVTPPVRMDLQTFYDIALAEKRRQCGSLHGNS